MLRCFLVSNESLYFLAAFKMFSLSLTFSIFYYNVSLDLFIFILLGVKLIVCVGYYFSINLGSIKPLFLGIIFFSFLSCHLYISIIYMMMHLMMSHVFLRLCFIVLPFFFFFRLVSFLLIHPQVQYLFILTVDPF